jgi:Protein of unknown function (DUF3108)
MKFCIFVLFLISAQAESLHYNINWPSGLSLGEATLSSERGPGGEKAAEKGAGPWRFGLDIDASVPGFTIRDHYHSTAGPDLCSSQLDKGAEHGKRKTEEKITFDQQGNTVTRETTGGGKADTSVSSCARDALSFIQFVRSELAQGRVAAQQQVVLGALYQTSIQYTGTQTIRLGDKKVEADRTVATIKGPTVDLTVEIFFARDAARTPLMARLPLALGTFTVELQQ